jgi:sugar O-acyltransferase (sialic acid O-acetyltransferase NeuD family)
MKKVYVYGAGGLGRDIIELAEAELDKKEYEVAGFIDDNKATQNLLILGYKVFSVASIAKDSYIVLAFGDPLIKKKIKKKIKLFGFKSLSIISKDAFISRTANIEEGVIIYPNSVIGSNTILRKDVLICGNVSIGHDVVIEEDSSISFNSSIGGFSKIGMGVYVGSGSHIRDEIEIGNNSLVGMGSVVIKSVESKKIVFGNPAQIKGDKGEKTVF